MSLPAFLIAVQATAAQVTDPVEFSRPLVKLLEAEWPKNRTVTIVCHGHSVPAGYFKTPTVQTFDAYPHLLHVAIKAKYPNAVVNVIVTAIGGEESDSGAKRFERDVMSLRPDVVLIDYGLNDRRIGLEKARFAWETMIASAKKGGALVVLLTPSWDTSVPAEAPSDPLNLQAVQIRALARQHGVGLADSFAAFDRARQSGADMGALMSQFNHPNRAGHALIVDGLLPWFGINPSEELSENGRSNGLKWLSPAVRRMLESTPDG